MWLTDRPSCFLMIYTPHPTPTTYASQHTYRPGVRHRDRLHQSIDPSKVRFLSLLLVALLANCHQRFQSSRGGTMTTPARCVPKPRITRPTNHHTQTGRQAGPSDTTPRSYARSLRRPRPPRLIDGEQGAGAAGKGPIHPPITNTTHAATVGASAGPQSCRAHRRPTS